MRSPQGQAEGEAKCEAEEIAVDGDYVVIKEERMPDGKTKRILKKRDSGRIVQRIS